MNFRATATPSPRYLNIFSSLQPQHPLALAHLEQPPGSSPSPTPCSRHAILPASESDVPCTSSQLDPQLLCSLPMGPPKILHSVSCSTRLVSTHSPELGVPPQNQGGEVHSTHSSILVSWTRKMAQQIKALATKPDDGSSIPRGT